MIFNVISKVFTACFLLRVRRKNKDNVMSLMYSEWNDSDECPVIAYETSTRRLLFYKQSGGEKDLYINKVWGFTFFFCLIMV